MQARFLATALAVALVSPLAAQSCVWGSFDASRINYSGGVLTTGNYVTMRAAIASAGGTLAAATPTLTAAYLSGVDVFYTSLLNTSTGTLSAAEQTALRNWIIGGGTLIVTGDIFPLPAYESFTQQFGVTNWRSISRSSVGNTVAAHPLTASVNTYRYVTNGGFTYGPDARLLGNDGSGDDFMIVMEPATGFSLGGRILVLGDHNMFTDTYVGSNDNTRLANNIAVWACSPPARCTWGSFDASRINYAGGTLTTGAHVGLRGAIAAAGGVLAPGTPTLTPAYLAGIQVFYTSLLSTSTGALSAAEQAALRAWVAGGGTLIVTGDIFPLPAYESFTQQFGVTNWRSISNNTTGNTVAAHPITAGVTTYRYNTNGGFTYGPDARLLGNDGMGADFMIVMEPATGFRLGGRILVLGDHNMFTDTYFAANDNTRLANNIAAWACSPLCAPASWANYGAGWPGTLGVPTFTSSANPVIGTSINLQVQNSSGANSVGVMPVGLVSASIPTPIGGTLLVVPIVVVNLPLPTPGVVIPVRVPRDPGLCGASLFLQVLQGDAGASHGFSFTRGMRLTIGS